MCSLAKRPAKMNGCCRCNESFGKYFSLHLQHGVKVPHVPEPGLNCALLVLRCVVTAGSIVWWLPPTGRICCELPNSFPLLWEAGGMMALGCSSRGWVGLFLNPFLRRYAVPSFFFYCCLLTLILHLLTLWGKFRFPKSCSIFMSEGYLHLAVKSAWPWKAICQQGFWSLCSLRPQ